MVDLTTAVTPHELDAWLQSTHMEDDVGSRPQLRKLSNIEVASTLSRDRAKKNKPLQRYGRRRSSLDDDTGVPFGIDARTHRMASTSTNGSGHVAAATDPQANLARLVSDGEIDSSTVSSPIGAHNGIQRETGSNQMEHSIPITTMYRRSSSGCSRSSHSHHSDSSLRTTRQGNRSSLAGASSSSDTDMVHNTGTFHRSVSDLSLGCSDSSIIQSASLSTSSAGLHFDQRSQSMPVSVGPDHGRQMLPAVAASTIRSAHAPQDLSHFLNAMELSQQSQDHINSEGHGARPRRSIAIMRETNRSRELILNVLSGSSHHQYIHRRASTSQVMGIHGVIEGNKSFPNYPHKFRNNGKNTHMMRVESLRQQDTRNIIISLMKEKKENAMLMSGMQHNHAAAKRLRGFWKSAPKHHIPTHDYLSSSSNKEQNHDNQGDFEEEMAVQAELQRIARDQRMLEMEQQQQRFY